MKTTLLPKYQISPLTYYEHRSALRQLEALVRGIQVAHREIFLYITR